MTIIPIMIGTFGAVIKELLKGLEDVEVGGRVETFKTTALLRRVLETQGTYCHSNSSESPSANTDIKKL